jgi:hypothetical protein
MNNKFLFILLAVVFLMGGVFAASISGMAVSVRENSAKSFSFAEKDYSVSVSEDSVSGGADVVINGEKISGVEAGDVVIVDGAEVEVKEVKKSFFGLGDYKVDLNVVESSEEVDKSGEMFIPNPLEEVSNSTAFPCSDTDGGLNYFDFGKVSVSAPGVKNIISEDFCMNSSFLSERKCTKSGVMETIIHECSYGCGRGECQTFFENIDFEWTLIDGGYVVTGIPNFETTSADCYFTAYDLQTNDPQMSVSMGAGGNAINWPMSGLLRKGPANYVFYCIIPSSSGGVVQDSISLTYAGPQLGPGEWAQFGGSGTHQDYLQLATNYGWY